MICVQENSTYMQDFIIQFTQCSSEAVELLAAQAATHSTVQE